VGGAEVFESREFTNAPPTIPVMKATMGLTIVKTGPSREYVTKMLSIPVCGVEMRNATVGPLRAPCLCRDIETGMTPHEQRGSGTPKKDAFSRGQMPLPPRCVSMNDLFTRTERIPATRKPKSRYGDISVSVCQNLRQIFVNVSFILVTTVFREYQF